MVLVRILMSESGFEDEEIEANQEIYFIFDVAVFRCL
jgi:hypothetical protein